MAELSSCSSRSIPIVSRTGNLALGQDTVLRIRAVMAVTGLSRATVYRLANDGRFPRSIPLGPRAVGWLASEVASWLQNQADKREAQA